MPIKHVVRRTEEERKEDEKRILKQRQYCDGPSSCLLCFLSLISTFDSNFFETDFISYGLSGNENILSQGQKARMVVLFKGWPHLGFLLKVFHPELV